MKYTRDKIYRLLAQEDPLDLEDYIRILYEACENRPYCNDNDIRQAQEELNDCVTDLQFRQQDRILSAVNNLGALYVYAGFSEGFKCGSELILELTDI